MGSASIRRTVGLGAVLIVAVGLVPSVAAQAPTSQSRTSRSSTSQTPAAQPPAAPAEQTPSSAPGDWVVPRTPDGHPDLQGNWTNVTLTPFQRRRGQGPVLTWDEVATLEGRAEARALADAQPSDPDRPAPEAGGAIGSYNLVFIDGGDRVAVVNGEPRSSLITIPSNGRMPALTLSGGQRLAEYQAFTSRFGEADHVENRPLRERCIFSRSSAGPPMIPNVVYNNNYTIVQTTDHVLIISEMVHDARIIRMGDGPRLPDHVRPWMGDSWGHWEGDVLVIETTNLHPLQTFLVNMPPSPDLRVIERLSRVDEETILYGFTIDDPTTFVEPWGGQIPMKALDDRLYGYACHEANYALSNILSGARYQERMDAENQN